MATTFIDYTGDGGATKPFSFPSIQESDIKVDVDGVIKTSGVHYNITGYTTGSGGSVVFTSGNIPVSPQGIRIFRDTDVDTAKATYTPGSSVKAADLNSNHKQLMFAAQEEQNQTIMAHDIKDGAITSAKITDGTIVNADINASAAIDGTKVNPNFGSQNIATTGTINSLTTTELAILDGATVSTAELNKLDGVTATTAEINKLDGVTATTAEINKLDGVTSTTAELNYVDGVTSNVQTQLDAKQDLSARLTTLAGMQSGTASKLADSTALTADLADLNQLDGMAKQTSLTDDDTKFPTSGAVIDYVTAQIAPIGGFEVIATDQAFPNTQPAAGVVISMADGGGLVVNGSGTSTTGRTVGGSTVTINNFASNFNSTTVDPGVAILVSSTGSGQVYNYHKATLKEADLLSLSGDINDFAERYRVVASEPTSDNDEGDLIYDKSADSIKVYDATLGAFKTINTTGDFKFLFLCPTGGSGAPTFDGTINTYDLRVGSNSGTSATVTNAAQLIVSIDGVIQKPNTGTSQPSEGFAMVDNNTIIFGSNLAAGVEVFISQIGDAVNIGTPHDNTVSTVKVQNLAVTTDKLANDAVTGAKIADNAIDSEHYVDGSIDTAHIADDAVTTDKLANSIVSDITANNAKVTNVTTNLSTSTTTTAVTVASSDGTNATIGEATSSAAGVMSSTHHDKLDGIEAGATGDQTNAEIRAAVEAATDSNVFTDADHSKLNGIEASATADQTASEIVALVADQTIAPSTIDMEDNEKIKLGTGDDLEIFHNGNSFITNTTATQFAIQSDNLRLRSTTDSENYIVCTDEAGVEIYWDGSKKLETTSSGVSVSGDLLVTGNFTLDNATNAGKDISWNQAENKIKFEDSVAAHFGSGNDLRIYHDGSNSRIHDNGTGVLAISGSEVHVQNNNNTQSIAKFLGGTTNSSAELYYNDSKKFETTSTGATVTGDLVPEANDTRALGTGSLQWAQSNIRELKVYEKSIHYDNVKALFGHGEDLEIYHDGTDSRIHNSTGSLVFRTGNNYIFYNSDASEKHAQFLNNGAVELYYDNSKKLETLSDGVNVTGTLKVNGSAIASGGLGNVVEDSTPQLGGDLQSNGNDIDFADNDRAYFGTGNDLEIFHDGTNSGIQNTGGGLYITTSSSGIFLRKDASEELGRFNVDGAAELYYDGSKKFNTTSDGGTLTGNLFVSEALQLNDAKKIELGNSADLVLYHESGVNYIQTVNSTNLEFYAGSDKAIKYVANGAVELYYDGALQCQTNSGGMNWADGKRAYFGNSSDLQIYHDGTNSIINTTTGSLLHQYNGTTVALQTDTRLGFQDNKKASFGTGNDMEIFHDGSNSKVNNSTGYVFYNSNSGHIFRNAASNEDLMSAYTNQEVSLYYDNSKKLETTSTGTKITGKLTFAGDGHTQGIELGADADIQFYHDNSNGYLDNNVGDLYLRNDGSSTSEKVRIQAKGGEQSIVCSPNAGVELHYDNVKTFETLSNGNRFHGYLYAGDNEEIYLGNSNDLRLWHDGTNSFIQNLTGALRVYNHVFNVRNDVGNEHIIQGIANEGVQLYYNGTEHAAITSYGFGVGSAGGSVFSGLTNYQAYVGFDAGASSTFGGIVLGSGPNGNSPFVAASKAGDGTGLNLDFRTNGSERMEIQNNGNIGAPNGTNIYNASDSRLKKNVTTLDKGLEAINALRPVSFNWIDGFCDVEKDPLYGFIAQEVQTVDSNLIQQFGKGSVTVGDQTINDPLRVNEKFIIPMLVKAVQELSAKVAALEAE